jgi:Trypsin-co-occurring domain 1
MASKLIELEDGIFVEVEAKDDEAQQISSRAADAVSSSFSKIKPLLKKAVQPIAEVWKELDQDVAIEAAEVTINFSFEGEGNIYVTKAKAGSNLSVKLILKPKR